MDVVLVTGGAGYIGAHTCKALAAAGFLPVTFDNLSTGFPHNVKWGPLVTGDVGDARALREVFRSHPVKGILHFAASTYVGESVAEPLRYYRNNVAAMLNLLEVLVEHGLPPVVFSSSCATYGVPSVNPVPVSHPQMPVSPYGWSKLMGERLILDTCRAHGLRAAILRYFNAAGADPDGDLREEHDPETHLIPTAIDAAMGKTPEMKIFGDDYPTRDGTCIRDYIHVSDLADAHVLALQTLLSGGSTFIRNLGTGKGHSIREVIAAIETVGGKPVPRVIHDRRPGDPPSLEADVEPEVSAVLKFPGLTAIIDSAWRSRAPAAGRVP